MNTNVEYFNECRDLYSYKEIGTKLKTNNQNGITSAHLADRGNYTKYPDRMATHRQKELFVNCQKCGRGHCTDAWAPHGYSSIYDRVVVTSHKDPNTWFMEQLYYCRDNCQ